jgi:hypothetical protein
VEKSFPGTGAKYPAAPENLRLQRRRDPDGRYPLNLLAPSNGLCRDLQNGERRVQWSTVHHRFSYEMLAVLSGRRSHEAAEERYKLDLYFELLLPFADLGIRHGALD